MSCKKIFHRITALKNKIWFRIFLSVGLIFAVFVFVLSIANKTALTDFYCLKQKYRLTDQIKSLSKLDFTDSDAVSQKLSELSESYHFEAELYDDSGRILYTTRMSQLQDYSSIGLPSFFMQHESLAPSKTEDMGNGITFSIANRPYGKEEILLCQKRIGQNLSAELRIPKRLMAESAETANEFIAIVSTLCFLLSVIWIFLFAKRFSQPITKMNEITRDMSQLDFSRKLTVTRTDEIGQLAESVNELSASLSAALGELNEKNARLMDEIEMERQLDVMRRGFVANVSHELKTPLSIISGYAEGLRLNINEKSREEYCNIIIDESKRMNQLVLSILELSRYESGQIPLHQQNFALRPLADELQRRIFADAAVTVQNQIPENALVYADPMQIEQVFKSYLENAKSHTPVGGAVTLSAVPIADGWRISVDNTGNPIPEDLMPQIWQSFFRGDTSHKRESTRFGLGLSIVSAVLKLHGRACGVNNTADGVSFWFELDRATASSPEEV
ncbi:MAG: HAMP domain-containing histidine kinase [Clostridia bacterium]|nr:HAMP domain-containing histidine kinase [Clostridia bacterium]